MNKLGLSPVSHERVTLEVTDSTMGVLVSIAGDIDMQDPSRLLDPFFLKLHQSAVQMAVDTIEVDFRQLNFLNSSGIKALAKWAMMLSQIPAETRYKIRFLHNKGATWQTTSLPTLTYLVPGAITLA